MRERGGGIGCLALWLLSILPMGIGCPFALDKNISLNSKIPIDTSPPMHYNIVMD
jgi:hypothetical protein